MSKRIVFTILCWLVASPAFAASTPVYDVEEICKELAVLAGGNAAVEAQCRKNEAAAKERIASMDVSDAVMRTCAEATSFGVTTYSMLEHCLKEETAKEKASGR